MTRPDTALLEDVRRALLRRPNLRGAFNLRRTEDYAAVLVELRWPSAARGVRNALDRAGFLVARSEVKGIAIVRRAKSASPEQP